MSTLSFGHRAALAGLVADAETGKPVRGARVEIAAGPPELSALLELRARQHGERWERLEERPDRTRSAADGHFHFLDLPAGDYTLAASVPAAGSRYGTATAQVTLTADGEGRPLLATADLTLQPTTVKGRIAGPDGTEPVGLAEVRVAGSGERTRSAGDGTYRLPGLEKGERSVIVAARGFQTPPPQTVVLADAGAVVTLDLDLETE